MPPSSGTYKITNVSIGLQLQPQHRSSGSNIVADKDDKSDKCKWIFQHIAGKTFKISNLASPHLFAYGGNNIPSSTEIKTDSSKQMFNVTHVHGTSDTYTISTIDSGVYWCMQSAVPGAKLITSDASTGRLQQFVLKRQ